MRAVIDPNVLISAVISPSGVTGQVARAALSRRFDLVACPRLIGELETVLRRSPLRRHLSIDEADEDVTAIEGVAHSPSLATLAGDRHSTRPCLSVLRLRTLRAA